MKQRDISIWLRIMIIGASAIVICAYIAVMPACADMIINAYPEFTSWKTPWIGFMSFTAIPILAAACYAWKIAVNIGCDRSFSIENAGYLNKIAVLSAFDAGFLFVGNVIMLMLNMNHPVVVLASVILSFVGIVISVAAAALSHLAYKAAILQTDAELTI